MSDSSFPMNSAAAALSTATAAAATGSGAPVHPRAGSRKRKAPDASGASEDAATASASAASSEASSPSSGGGRVWVASGFTSTGNGSSSSNSGMGGKSNGSNSNGGGDVEGISVTKHGPWSKEEDEALLAAYADYRDSRKGRPHWVLMSRRLGETRLPEACRLRFKHVLEPRLSGVAGMGAWSKEEDRALIQAFELYGHTGRSNGPDWVRIAESLGSRRSTLAYRQRYTSVLAPRANKQFKGPWSKAEDDALIAAYEEFKFARRSGQPDWKAIAARMGDQRLPKAYRQRYAVVLVPRRLSARANHGAWSTEEDAALLAAYEEFKNAGRDGGADWIAVSDRLGGARSALAARTHFVNVLMPKQRLEKQVGQWDPQEDALLIHAYEEFKHAGKDGGVNWTAIAERLGNRRAASACRMRFLRTFAAKSTLAMAGWTPELDQALLEAYVQYEHSGPGGRPCMKSIAGSVGNGLKAKQCMLRLRELLPPAPAPALTLADMALSQVLYSAGVGEGPGLGVTATNAATATTVATTTTNATSAGMGGANSFPFSSSMPALASVLGISTGPTANCNNSSNSDSSSATSLPASMDASWSTATAAANTTSNTNVGSMIGAPSGIRGGLILHHSTI